MSLPPHQFPVRPFDEEDGYYDYGNGVNPRPQCSDLHDNRTKCLEKFEKSFNDCLYQGEDPNRTIQGSQGVGVINSWRNVRPILTKALQDVWDQLSPNEKDVGKCVAVEWMDQKPLVNCSTHRYRQFLDPPCSPALRLLRPPRGDSAFGCENAARKRCMDCCKQNNGVAPTEDYCGSATGPGGSTSGKSSVGLSGFLTGSDYKKSEVVEIFSFAPVSYPYKVLTANFYTIGNEYDYTLDLDAARRSAVQTYLTGGSGNGDSGGYFANNPSLDQQCATRCSMLFDVAIQSVGKKLNEKLYDTMKTYVRHYENCRTKYSQLISNCVKQTGTGPIGKPPPDLRPPVPGDTRIGGPLPVRRIGGQRL